MAISVISGPTGCGKTLFATTMSKILKNKKYDFIAANYRLNHGDMRIESINDFSNMKKNKSILIIMDEAYEDIDSRKSFDRRVNQFTRNLMQLRKRGGRGYDTDCWIIAQDFYMIDYRIRQNTDVLLTPSIVAYADDGRPAYLVVDIQKYNPVWGLGRSKSFSLYCLPFLDHYDTDEVVSGTNFEDVTLQKLIEKYLDDDRCEHLNKTELQTVIYYEAEQGGDNISKSDARFIASMVKTKLKEAALREQGIIA